MSNPTTKEAEAGGSNKSFWLSPEQHNFWDIILKIIGTIALFIGAGWALYEHFDAEEQKVNAAFWNKRMELYLETSKTAAAIAGADSATSVTSEIKEFWQLFYGSMSVLEDDAVKTEMQKFAGVVRAFQGPGHASAGVVTKPVPTEYESLPPDALHAKKKELSKSLADAMQLSLKKSWPKPFER